MRILVGITAVLTIVIAGLVLVAIIRGRIPGLPASLPKLAFGELTNVLSLLLNLLMLLIALMALYLAGITFQQSVTSGGEQQKTLDASRDALTSVLETLRQQQTALQASRQALEGVRETVKQQQETMTGMLAAGRRQYQVIEEQNARERERLARRPEVQLSVDGVPATGAAQVRLAPTGPDGWRRLEFGVKNTGNAALRDPIIVVEATPPQVRLRTTGGQNTAPNAIQIVPRYAFLPDDPIRVGYGFPVDVLVPQGTRATVEFKMVGENLPFRRLTLEVPGPP